MPMEWMSECVGNHPECQGYSDSISGRIGTFPTRLIDVTPQDGLVRLVVPPRDYAIKKYLALSHRWTNDMITTTQKSLNEYQTCLPFDSMSQCFKDSVEITKQLGFRYLWIDALCIIQDSLSDVAKECSNMKNIYRDCAIMLAADSVYNNEDSLYPVQPDSDETSLPFYNKRREAIGYWTLSSRQLGSFETDVLQGVLSSRGWTLQERVLAPRILHFGKHQLYWECRTSKWWEGTAFRCAFYTPDVLDESREMITFLTREHSNMPSQRDISKIGDGATQYTTWYDLVSSYSCRQLTFPTDRLRAISGLADLFAEWVGDKLVWGLWVQDLPAGLLWTVQGSNPLVRFTGPTWSWTSIDGELTFHIPCTKWGRPIEGILRCTCEDVTLQNYVMDLQTYISGKLSFKCPILLILLQIPSKIEGIEGYPFDHLTKQPNAQVREVLSGSVIGIATLDDDARLNVKNSSKRLLLYAAMLYRQDPNPKGRPSKRNTGWDPVSYCILLEDAVELGLSQRCGYAEIQSSAFSEAETQNVTVV